MRETTAHPHNRPAKIACACGAVYDTFSTRGDFAVEICSKCHPFYTGTQKLMDTAGRIDRFKKRYGLKVPADTVTVPADAEPKPPTET